MFLAEEAAVKASNFTGFDIFMILFTLLIGYGVLRSFTAPKKNLFAIGFGLLCLAVFLFLDVMMVLNWFDLLNPVDVGVE